MADTHITDGTNKVHSSSQTTNTKFGFSDPSGEMPLPEYHYKPSLNKQAVGAGGNTIDIKGGDPSIDIAGLVGKKASNSNYGDVSVKKTKSGHVLIFDDTFDNESVLIKHKDGSGFILKSDGTMIMNTKRNRVTSIGGTDALIVEGDIKISCQNLEMDVTGDMDVNVGGDYNLTIGGEKTEDISGSTKEKVSGHKSSTVVKSRSETTVESKTTTVLGTDTNITKGNVTYTIGGHFDLGAKSYSKITSQAQIAYTAPQIDIIGVKGQIALKQGIFGGEHSFFYGLNYYGRSAKFDKGVTAPTFHGDLQGTALEAMRANEAGIHSASSDYGETDGSHGGSSFGFTITDVNTNLIRDGKGPSDDSITDMLNADPRGIKKVSIDDTGDLVADFSKVNLTVAQARALLKDPETTIEFKKQLIEDGLLGTDYFNTSIPGIGRVTNGNTVYASGTSTDFVGGRRQITTFVPDSTYDPNRLDPNSNLFAINSKTLLSLGIPMSTFLAGANGANTLNHLETFKKRQQLARQLLLQAEVVKIAREDEEQFKNYKLIVAEGVSKGTHSVDSIPYLRTSGRAIVYELYDEENKNLPGVTYEFAAYLADQLPVYDKISLNYDTVEPHPGLASWEKVKAQVVVIMPEVDKGYNTEGNAKYSLQTVYNDTRCSDEDLVELSQNDNIILASSSPAIGGKKYTSADFPLSGYPTKNARMINQLHPKIRKRFADGINHYLKNTTDRDVEIRSAYRSYAEQKDLYDNNKIAAAAPGRSFHQYMLAVDMIVYVKGVEDNGTKGIGEYTGALRRSMATQNLMNFFDDADLMDPGHFHPLGYGKVVPNDLLNGKISLDAYIDGGYALYVNAPYISIVPQIKV